MYSSVCLPRQVHLNGSPDIFLSFLLLFLLLLLFTRIMFFFSSSENYDFIFFLYILFLLVDMFWFSYCISFFRLYLFFIYIFSFFVLLFISASLTILRPSTLTQQIIQLWKLKQIFQRSNFLFCFRIMVCSSSSSSSSGFSLFVLFSSPKRHRLRFLRKTEHFFFRL